MRRAAERLHVLTEELVLGAITPRQLVKAVQAMRRITATNLIALNDYIAVADSQVARQRSHCASLSGSTTTTTPKPPPSATSFMLQPWLTKVGNPYGNELIIDPSAGTAHEDHCCSGGGWKVDYSWKVPQTLTPGKTAELTLHVKFLSVNPNQPLGLGMSAFAPDFAQQLLAHWPDNPDVEKTYDVPISASLKDSSDITVSIHIESASIEYHYRK